MALQGSFNISETGFWEAKEDQGHYFDEKLSKALVEYFHGNDYEIVDMGCGNGSYTRYFREFGLRCDGYDGNPNTPMITQGLCGVIDLTHPMVFTRKYDWVMCLEVGEHIPPRYESIFIDNICKIAKLGIVLSWAIEGQPGIGHVNCRSNDYVRARIAERGFNDNCELATLLRSNVMDKCYWFRDTIMVFEKA